MNKIKLNILGLSYSQTNRGAYALILSEEQGKRRIPIIIGSNEAQAIAIQLENIQPVRPLTHDLFLSLANSFNINLVEVNIYKLDEGIFYSELVCENNINRIKIDSRTSDAIALAIRFQCPIYTTEDILQKAGIIIEDENASPASESERPKDTTDELSSLSIQELEKRLQEAIDNENYELASEIRDEISQRE